MRLSNKNSGSHHPSHERWIVSYADFVTPLFAFLVVMFSTANADKGKARAVGDSVRAALPEGRISNVGDAIRQALSRDGAPPTHKRDVAKKESGEKDANRKAQASKNSRPGLAWNYGR